MGSRSPSRLLPTLNVPLDVLVVRKLRTPGHAELAFGAVASGGVRWLLPGRVPVDDDTLAAITAAERAEIDDRERRYRIGPARRSR